MIPFGEYLMHFFMGHTQAVFHKLVCLANQLHIAVFDTVVYHFDEMSRTIPADPIATRLTLRGFRGNRLENRFNSFPCTLISARHDRRAVPRAFLSAGDSHADKQNTFFGKVTGASGCIRIIGISSVNDDIALIQKRQQLFDKVVNHRTCLNHQHNFSWFFQFINQVLQRICADNIRTLCSTF